jgi:hypothetical protein
MISDPSFNSDILLRKDKSDRVLRNIIQRSERLNVRCVNTCLAVIFIELADNLNPTVVASNVLSM